MCISKWTAKLSEQQKKKTKRELLSCHCFCFTFCSILLLVFWLWPDSKANHLSWTNFYRSVAKTEKSFKIFESDWKSPDFPLEINFLQLKYTKNYIIGEEINIKHPFHDLKMRTWLKIKHSRTVISKSPSFLFSVCLFFLAGRRSKMTFCSFHNLPPAVSSSQCFLFLH